MTTEIPLSKLKQDRDKKKLSKTLKRQEFKWLDVHNTINLITGQLQIYLTTLNSIKQLPVEAKQILDENKELNLLLKNESDKDHNLRIKFTDQ